jgi:hypothetical protein
MLTGEQTCKSGDGRIPYIIVTLLKLIIPCKRFEVFKAVKMSIVVFWVLIPCNDADGFKHFGIAYHLSLPTLVTTYKMTPSQQRRKTSTLKMKAICSSETLVISHKTARHHNPEEARLP